MRTKVLASRYEEKTKETETIKETLQEEAAKVEEQRAQVEEVVEQRFEKERLKILKEEYSRAEQLQQKLQSTRYVRQNSMRRRKPSKISIGRCSA